MELLDLIIEIERYMHRKGLTDSDSIQALIEAMEEDSRED